MIQDQIESQSSEQVSHIMSGNDELNEGNYAKFEYLAERDVYMRISQNVELIELYLKINRAIINDQPNQSALFVRVTEILAKLKATFEAIQLQPTFKHPWFPGKGTVSFWDYFNRFNLESENKDEAQNIKTFFSNYDTPQIPSSDSNLRNLKLLEQYSQEFRACVRASTGKCCSCLRLSTVLFGRSDQAKRILSDSF